MTIVDRWKGHITQEFLGKGASLRVPAATARTSYEDRTEAL